MTEQTKTRLMLQVIWAAFIGSLTLVLVVAALMVDGPHSLESVTEALDESFSLSDPLALGLLVAGLGLMALGLGAHLLFRQHPVSSQAEPDPYSRGDVESAKGLFVMRLALLEGVGLIGFVMGLLQNNWVAMLPLWILGALGILISFPSPSLLRKLASDR